MNWRSTARGLDWAVPLGFGAALCWFAPLRTALEFGGDEGYELMKSFLVSLGHPLYREVWNDQPPLHTELLALLFRVFGPSVYVGRLLSVGFAMALVASLYRLVSGQSGRVAGLVAVGLLVSSSSFLQLSVSVMIELPAMALALSAVWAGTKYFEEQGSQPELPSSSSTNKGGGSTGAGVAQSSRASGSGGARNALLRSRWWLVLSGALLGCALQVKLTAAIFLPALAVEFVVRRTRHQREVEQLDERPPWLEARRGNDASPITTNRKAGQAVPRTPECGGARTPRPARETVIWCGVAAALFGVITLVFYGWKALPMFWSSHFSAATEQAVLSQGYAFRPATLLNDLALLAPATVGVALVGWKRRWGLLFPVVLLATAFAIHLWHRPYWYYYRLHFAIPLAWLGAVGIVEPLPAIWKGALGPSLWTKLRAGVGWLGWSLVVSLVLALAPEKAWNEFMRLLATDLAREDPRVTELKEHAAETRWVFTDRVIYAFWAGLPVPPELAVVPSKRIWSGQITGARMVECLERYRPEQILLLSDWEAKFGLADYLDAHYEPGPGGGAGEWYLRKR